MKKLQVLTKELEKTERRNAELVSKNSSLSAELESFKTYMRDTGERMPDAHTFTLSRPVKKNVFT